MDAGGRATAVWSIVTFAKPARSPNPSGNAAMFKSAASPRKWTQTVVQLYFYISAVLKVVLIALPPYAHPQMTWHFRVIVRTSGGKKKNVICVWQENLFDLLTGGRWKSGVPAVRLAENSATRAEWCSACRRSTTAPTGPYTANTAQRIGLKWGEPVTTPCALPSGGQGRGLRWARRRGHLHLLFLSHNKLVYWVEI